MLQILLCILLPCPCESQHPMYSLGVLLGDRLQCAMVRQLCSACVSVHYLCAVGMQAARAGNVSSLVSWRQSGADLGARQMAQDKHVVQLVPVRSGTGGRVTEY